MKNFESFERKDGAKCEVATYGWWRYSDEWRASPLKKIFSGVARATKYMSLVRSIVSLF